MTSDSAIVQKHTKWRRTVRRTLRGLVTLRYKRFSPDRQGNRMVRVAGLQIWVGRGVFDPSLYFTSAFMVRYLRQPGVVPKGARVLDVGTGTGVLAIAAARAGAIQVTAIDASPDAARCAMHNVRRVGLADVVQVRRGDYAETTQGETFDLMVCNPPYFRGAPRSEIDAAYLGGPDYEWFDRFALQAALLTVTGGRVLVVLSDASDLASILAKLNGAPWSLRVVARRDILIEVLYIIELVKVNKKRPS